MALSPSGLPQVNRSFIILSLILIILLGVIVYANSLQGQFVWDDEVLVQFNPYIKDWSHVPKIFTSRLGSTAKEGGAFYRPVQTFTYLVDYSIWRLNVLGYHLGNMVFHILAALSLFWLVRVLFRRPKLALITALLFVVHPIHTEAVSYISGRADSLAALFMFLAFVFYIKHGQRQKKRALILMMGCYVLAALSKELSLILPVLVLFYHYASQKPIHKKAFTGLAVVSVAYILWRVFYIGSASLAQGEAPTFFTRLPGVFIAFFNYMHLLIWPFDLHMEYGGRLFSYGEPKAAFGALLFIGLLGIVLFKKNKDRFLLFAAGWFLITLLPSSNVFYPINAYMAEHWLYLPSVGFFLLIARFLANLMEQERSKGLAIVLTVVLVSFFSMLTIRQNAYWRNGVNFYKHMIRYAPDSSRLYNNLAKAYHDAGKNDELITLLESAIQLQEDNALAHNNLGNAYKESGQLEKAIRSYQRAIEIDPDHAGPYYNISTIYSEIPGKEDETITLLNKAIELSPYFSKAYNKLGLIYLQRGQLEKTTELLNTALKLNPDDPEVYHNFGYVYFQQQEYKKAEAMYQKALEINPNYVQAYHDLAVIYVSLGNYQAAIQYCDRAVAMGYVDKQLLGVLKPYR